MLKGRSTANLITHCKFSQSTGDLKFKQWMALNILSLLKEESCLMGN